MRAIPEAMKIVLTRMRRQSASHAAGGGRTTTRERAAADWRECQTEIWRDAPGAHPSTQQYIWRFLREQKIGLSGRKSRCERANGRCSPAAAGGVLTISLDNIRPVAPCNGP